MITKTVCDMILCLEESLQTFTKVNDKRHCHYVYFF